ncbi:MAG: FadR/GntR family transcriptional regulator, partial [Anaerovoracaceae bacterium]
MHESQTPSLKIEKQTAYSQVYDRLKEYILDRQWEPGEKLPSENELSQMFGVNRLTIRMALQRLNAFGLTETRVGDGTYVKDFDFSSYMDEIQDLYADPKLLDDVCEFRKLIELPCARLAMERATPEELSELERICTEYEALKGRTTLPLTEEALDQLVEMDTAFHYQICKMSHNTLLVYAYSVAKNTIQKHIRVALRERTDGWSRRQISLTAGDYRHRAILDAIRCKDFATCERLYSDMIDHT